MLNVTTPTHTTFLLSIEQRGMHGKLIEFSSLRFRFRFFFLHFLFLTIMIVIFGAPQNTFRVQTLRVSVTVEAEPSAPGTAKCEHDEKLSRRSTYPCV